MVNQGHRGRFAVPLAIGPASDLLRTGAGESSGELVILTVWRGGCWMRECLDAEILVHCMESQDLVFWGRAADSFGWGKEPCPSSGTGEREREWITMLMIFPDQREKG